MDMVVTEEEVDDPKRSEFLRSLFTTFEGENGLSKCCAVRALERVCIGDDASVSCLLKALDDGDPDVRADAAASLGRLGISRAADALLDHLKRDPEGDVRIEVARALGNVASGDVVAALEDCVKAEGYPDLDALVDDYEFSPAWDVQAQALESLGRIGDASVAISLATFLRDPDNDHLFEAGFRVLGSFDNDDARQFLLERLEHGEDRARQRAARALGLMLKNNLAGAAEQRILAALTATLEDRVPEVRIAAAHALSDLDGAVAVSPLIRLLTDDNEDVRIEVIRILGKFTGEAVRHNLEILLKDPRPGVKRAAIEELGKMGDPASAEALEALLDTSDDRLAFDVVEALGLLGLSASQVSTALKLSMLLQDTRQHRDIRIAAASVLGEALQEMEPEDASVIEEALCETIDASDPSVAAAALTGLMTASPERAGRVIVAFFEDDVEDDEATDEAIADGSAASEDEETFEIPDPSKSTLGAILFRAHLDAETVKRTKPVVAPDDPRRRLKLLGLRLLGLQQQTSGLALGILAEFADAADAAFRREAIASLALLEPELSRDLLVEALCDPDSTVRQAALTGLSQVDRDEDLMRVLGARISDEEARIRQDVAGIAGGMDETSQRSVLVPALKDDHQLVSQAAMKAVDQGDLLPETRQALLAAGFRYSGNLRFELGRALGRTQDLSGISSLLEVLDDPDKEEYHWMCMDALAEVFSINEGSSGAGV